jgi:hypothetical protein
VIYSTADPPLHDDTMWWLRWTKQGWASAQCLPESRPYKFVFSGQNSLATTYCRLHFFFCTKLKEKPVDQGIPFRSCAQHEKMNCLKEVFVMYGICIHGIHLLPEFLCTQMDTPFCSALHSVGYWFICGHIFIRNCSCALRRCQAIYLTGYLDHIIYNSIKGLPFLCTVTRFFVFAIRSRLFDTCMSLALLCRKEASGYLISFVFCVYNAYVC